MLRTADYYRRHAQAYALSTRNVDMAPLYERFLALVPAGGLILDAGCGSGRDSLAFTQRGYRVEAFDASPELAELAAQHTGLPVHVRTFLTLTDTARFDAIWACASLLHVPECDQPEAWARLWAALKAGGVIYASYKLGQGKRTDEQGRAFTDADEARLTSWIQPLDHQGALHTWLTHDQRPSQQQTWLNVLVQRHPATP